MNTCSIECIQENKHKNDYKKKTLQKAVKK